MHSAKVTVATTATLIVPADDKPRTIYIHNAGGAKIYVGGSSVTTTTGFHIGNGDHKSCLFQRTKNFMQLLLPIPTIFKF